MNTYNLQLTRLVDLVGQPVQGRMADVRSRRADGTLVHTTATPILAPLITVSIQKLRKSDWLRWSWEGTGINFSGIRLHQPKNVTGVPEYDEVYILIEPPNKTSVN